MTETEPESGTEPGTVTETEPESGTGTEPESGAAAGTSLPELLESGGTEMETGMMVLHGDMQQVHTDLQAICCFIVVFLIILLCQYAYRFFRMFF